MQVGYNYAAAVSFVTQWSWIQAGFNAEFFPPLAMKLIITSILISVAFAQLDLYVATNGSDSNPGTSPAAAVRSITKARDILRSKRPLPNGGAVVHIFPGVYVGESPIQLTD